MKKRSIRERKIEEKKVFWNSLVEENKGNKEKSMLDFQFFERCLNIQKTKLLMPKGYGWRRNYQSAIEDMVDLSIQEYKEHGFEI